MCMGAYPPRIILCVVPLQCSELLFSLVGGDKLSLLEYCVCKLSLFHTNCPYKLHVSIPYKLYKLENS